MNHVSSAPNNPTRFKVRHLSYVKQNSTKDRIRDRLPEKTLDFEYLLIIFNFINLVVYVPECILLLGTWLQTTRAASELVVLFNHYMRGWRTWEEG